MGNLRKIAQGCYEIYFSVDLEVPMGPSLLIDSFLNARSLENKGRGGIKILDIEGRPVACRKYIHGGLLRGITRDIFFTEKRAIDEFEIMLYLKENKFPIISPFCLVIERHLLTRNPYILSYYEENAADLLDFLRTVSQKERLRTIKRLAELMCRLEALGVFHPDLHLNNMLVTNDGDIKFLDFDRAYRKNIAKKDMEWMFWRLNRYAEKMEREGKIKIGAKEKLLFLRVYGRLSGFDMVHAMAAKAGQKKLLSRVGWFFEGLFYRGQNNS